MKQHITSLLICATFLTGCYVIPIQDGSRIVQTSSANAVSTPSNSVICAQLTPLAITTCIDVIIAPNHERGTIQDSDIFCLNSCW